MKQSEQKKKKKCTLIIQFLRLVYERILMYFFVDLSCTAQISDSKTRDGVCVSVEMLCHCLHETTERKNPAKRTNETDYACVRKLILFHIFFSVWIRSCGTPWYFFSSYWASLHQFYAFIECERDIGISFSETFCYYVSIVVSYFDDFVVKFFVAFSPLDSIYWNDAFLNSIDIDR